MATLWDLYATFGHVAGLSAAAAVADPVGAAASLPPIDSIDQWDWWSGRASEPPRAELAIGTAGGSSHGGGNLFRVTSVEALIRDGMKLILTLPGISVDTAGVSGVIDEAIWTGPDFPNKTSNANAWNTARDCSQGCLYNLTEDHTEHVDLASALPLLASQMRERLEQINRTAFSPARGPNRCAADATARALPKLAKGAHSALSMLVCARARACDWPRSLCLCVRARVRVIGAVPSDAPWPWKSMGGFGGLSLIRISYQPSLAAAACCNGCAPSATSARTSSAAAASPTSCTIWSARQRWIHASRPPLPSSRPFVARGSSIRSTPTSAARLTRHRVQARVAEIGPTRHHSVDVY
jgi:hypothetical protein